MRLGANLGPIQYFQTVNPTPDLGLAMYAFDLNHGCQTTISLTHNNADGFFQIADLNFHGTPGQPVNLLPGASNSLTALKCKDTAGAGVNTITITGNIVAGTGIVVVGSITGGADGTFTNGSVFFSNNANAYQNPNFSTLAQAVDTGYSTGYPDGLGASQLFQISSFGLNCFLPAGTYTFLADGTGTIAWSSVSYSDGSSGSNGSVTFTNGVANPNTMVLTKTLSSLTLKINASTQGQALRNVSIVMPDRANVTPADGFVATFNANRGIANKNFFLVHPTMAAAWGPFLPLRAMDIRNTNNSNLTSYANRPTPGWKMGFLNYPNGIPDETLAALAANKELWLNTKHTWSDADHLLEAQWWRDNFTARVYVEFSNEVWNSTFKQSIHATTQGIQQNNPYFVSSLTYNSGTGKCTAVITNHGFNTNDVVCFTGATDANFNGEGTVTKVDANTVTFTPSSAPATATAAAKQYHYLLALPVTSAQMKTVTSAVWTLAATTSNLVITATAHGFTSTNEFVVLLNCTDEAFNTVFKIQSTTTNTITVTFDGQAHPLTLPALTLPALTATAVVKAGMTMRVCRLGSNGTSSGALFNSGNGRDLWYGTRAAQVHKIWHDAFAAKGALSRLALVPCYQAAGSTTNINLMMNQYVATLPGGVLYTDTKHYLGFAPYYGIAGQFDTNFLGTVKTITAGNLTFAAGTCTCILTAHGYSTNDKVLIANTVDTGYTGVYTITVSDANTFTYTPVVAPGSSPAVVNQANLGMAAVKNNPYQLEYVNAVLAAGVVTFTSYGHGLTTGTKVCFTGQRYPDWVIPGQFVVTVVDVNTFTVVAPNSTALNATRGWFFPVQAITDLHASSETYRTVTVAGWITTYQSASTTYGIDLACYECGQSNLPLTANQNWPALGAIDGLYCAWNRSGPIQAQYTAYITQLQTAGVQVANVYDHSGIVYSKTGSWGLLEYQDQDKTTISKWLAAVAPLSSQVGLSGLSGMSIP